jgi:hypothetical protein
MCTHRLMLLNVQPDGSARAASTRQANDNSVSIVEFDIQTLVLGFAAINGIGVREVSGIRDLAARDIAANEATVIDLVGEGSGKLLSTVGVHVLIVESSKERPCDTRLDAPP